ncbi:MAG: hypothetical protein IIA50_01245 [Bacteroidetes bacterium]|nr:hypothetical protein [Bacteroidota bacterium]
MKTPLERATLKNFISKYRLELLPAIPAFHRRARRRKSLDQGQLVYYGPMPSYYGIGEVKHVVDGFVAVDFRGTGYFGVHEDVFEPQYLIPIPASTLSLL